MTNKDSKPFIRDLDHFHSAVEQVCKATPKLQKVVDTWGVPPLWLRRPGFLSLVHIILEQQVSLASAQAVMDKLRERLPRATPRTFLLLKDDELRSLGFSRQKTLYVRGLAQAILDRSLPIKQFKTLPSQQVYDALVALKGIGPWTANIYLMMVMRHPDIWPVGDLALRLAMRELFEKELNTLTKKLARRVSEKNATAALKEDDIQKEFAKRWQPNRSVAVRICWLHYLRVRNR